jgi:hypothetical protein
MTEPVVKIALDPCLRPLVDAADDGGAEQVLDALLAERVRPWVLEVIGYKLSSRAGGGQREQSDVQDICSEVCVRVLQRLREVRRQPGEEAIADLKAYVAVTAYNAFHQYLRQRHPQRHRLANRVRYVLRHRDRLALWADDAGTWWCGLAEWRMVERERERNRESESRELSPGPGNDLVRAIEDALRLRGQPMRLEELVDEVASRVGIVEETPLADHAAIPDERFAATAAVDERAERAHLQRLWSEIRLLPVGQRRALLLNLRDDEGEGCLEVFALAGVATISALAAALELTAAELARLWSSLPLPDNEIAERFQWTRQQVINLRQSARQRLVRRVRAWDTDVSSARES